MAKPFKHRVDKPMDQETVDTLNKVSNQINTNNTQLIYSINSPYAINTPTITPAKLLYLNNPLNSNSFPLTATGVNMTEETEVVAPSPNIDMEKDIYKNAFEEFMTVEIGSPKDKHFAKIVDGTYYPPTVKGASVGLIDSVSENDDDLYAKLDDGEIIPFKGHDEKISVEFYTWNQLHKSDLLGNTIKKAATCHIMIDDRLARIIEGTDIQDLLMKADRAIDELKTMPYSICRDAQSLVSRKIYYDNQPAIIIMVDELNNFIHIVPDQKFISKFLPPPYAVEDGETEEWVEKYGQGMLVRDYDEKIWWWRDNNGNADPADDPFYQQFPQPVQPAPPSVQQPFTHPAIQPNINPNTGINSLPNGTIIYGNGYTTVQNIKTAPITGGDTMTLTWTMTGNDIYPPATTIGAIDSDIADTLKAEIEYLENISERPIKKESKQKKSFINKIWPDNTEQVEINTE